MAEIHGLIDERFAQMADLLSASIDAGTDVGASIAVTVDGEFVVDAWGGSADEARSTPWAADTITNVWSSTKTMMTITALVAVDRGYIDVHAPVADYWPEFAANGKEAITVANLMSHTSGVSAWAQPITMDDVIDREKSTAMLAEQAPWWEPGTASGYHALNQGHLVGEVVRRTTGRTLGQYFADEIAGPLEADFHIGLADEHHHRVSNVIPPPHDPVAERAMGNLDPNSLMVRTLTSPGPDASYAWKPEWRRAEVPAANGHGNARSAALIQSVVANNGEMNGIRLLSKDTIDLIFEEQSNGLDVVLNMPVRFGIGYGLYSPESSPHLPGGRIASWGGWGGSVVIVDTDRNMVITYMMNKMQSGLLGDFRGINLVKAAYAAI